MKSPDINRRRAGILLHPTSLPSGVLDGDVERWLSVLAQTGLSVWQVLPLGEPQAGLSPYQCSSAFAFNPALMPEFVPPDTNDSAYVAFCSQQQFWLDDYVLFKVLKQQFDDKSWNEWPDPWKFRESTVIQQAVQHHETDITCLKWQQYQLHKRWQEIRSLASSLDILLFGDMPIYVGFDSADVWAHPELFLLDAEDNMEVVSGVPPDYFSEHGQRWGNPHYNWDSMQNDDFVWWKSRVRHHLELFDLVRIDHFRGLEAAWMIDASCETAIDGYWQKMPGDALLSSIQSMINNGDKQLPFIAEDLGIITPEVTALRKKYRLPGMSVLQFGFDEFDDNPHKLKNIVEDKVVYIGTHDNDTTKGWFNSLQDHVKNHVLQVLNLAQGDGPDTDTDIDTADIVIDKLIDDALQSTGIICMIPMQDCLHLGTEARMNTPGTITGNWLWKFQWQQLEQQQNTDRMKHIRLRIENTHRLPALNN